MRKIWQAPDDLHKLLNGAANLEKWQARQHLSAFTLYMKPSLDLGWFHLEICLALEQFYQDVIDKRSPRLMIFAPPRHGKSELFSRMFPAWALGKNPDLSLIATSYAADLSSRMNRDVQRIIDSDEYHSVFPETHLNGKNIVARSAGALRNSDIFEVVNYNGVYRSAGVGGGITGMGGEIGIIDDPVKDAKEANSETVRRAVLEWYETTFYTRIAPGGGILLAMTRWNEDDLAGALLKKNPDEWKVLKFPAIATHDEKHRKEGEALHPERWHLKALLKTKKTISEYSWGALYQQNPKKKGGNLIKGDWFKRYTQLPELHRIIITCDTANKTKTANDYSVFLCAGIDAADNVHVLDVKRGKWKSPDLITTAKDFWNKHKRKAGEYLGASEFYIEDKQSGTTLVQHLELELGGIVIPVQRNIDKFTRVNGVLPRISGGNVYLPMDAEWVSDFISECEDFTDNDSHAFDDQVDALCDAIEILVYTPTSFIEDVLPY